MKLYAIRDKNTGKYLEYLDSIDNYELTDESATVWQNEDYMPLPYYIPILNKELDADLEVVTLRIEPSEPCWHCKGSSRQDPDNVWRDKFCRKCGRGLA